MREVVEREAKGAAEVKQPDCAASGEMKRLEEAQRNVPQAHVATETLMAPGSEPWWSGPPLRTKSCN